MSEPTFVAMTTSSWRPRRPIQRPMIVSDSPPRCPVTQREYEFAVSIRLKPAATKRSSSANDVGSSAVQPNTLPPSANGATRMPLRPRGRFSTMKGLVFDSLRLRFRQREGALRSTLQHQIVQSRGHDVRRPPQILEQQVLVGPLGVRLGD